MKSIFGRVASRLLAETGDGARRLARAAGLAILALALAVVALGFATAGGFLLLRDKYGTSSGMFVIAGAYAVVALIIGASLALGRRQPEARQSTAQMKQTVIEELKKEAGTDRERVALLAGAQIAQHLRPVHILLLSLIAGVIAGARFDRH
ncbi:MAG: hypothetical protein JO163_07750 [Methylobacteriaceae bacterium]|nr:hypothetical protein [Methylobacteriaceae bacterium]MBV9702605.1 hypothetical protein [Methylobacteriaceae bacterium]